MKFQGIITSIVTTPFTKPAFIFNRLKPYLLTSFFLQRRSNIIFDQYIFLYLLLPSALMLLTVHSQLLYQLSYRGMIFLKELIP